jgi:hypothetical protein
VYVVELLEVADGVVLLKGLSCSSITFPLPRLLYNRYVGTEHAINATAATMLIVKGDQNPLLLLTVGW